MDYLSCWKAVNTLFFLHDPPELPEEIIKCWPNIIDMTSGKSQAIFSFF